MRATDSMAVNALYAALFEPEVHGLKAKGLPQSQVSGPDYLNVLKVTDIPEVLQAVSTQKHFQINR